MYRLHYTLGALAMAVVVVVLSADGVAASLSLADSPEMNRLSRHRRSAAAADESEYQLNRRERREAAAGGAISGVIHPAAVAAEVVPLSAADLKHASEDPESEESWIGNEEVEDGDDGEVTEKRKWGDNKARVWGKRKWGDNRARVWGKRRAMSPAVDDYLEKFEAENRKLTDEAAQSGSERNSGKRKWGENKARIWG